ncbi:LADA_0G00892g1_1 [Lachancea dasiensis]|uniref:LADA_0G00892g1_1 n=1 Tax=Lachancea dasiensis TaxID=1072105 RepID=A0A1G4JQG6_9SACH|nr:LADA_0G00892g1_1 [Lachancea dasiensis]
MAFFYDNSVIGAIQKIFRRPSDAAMWLFTGMIVIGTFYTILGPAPGPGPNAKRRR